LGDDGQNFLVAETAIPNAGKVQANAGIRMLGTPGT
jgi:hypothetical protein